MLNRVDENGVLLSYGADLFKDPPAEKHGSAIFHATIWRTLVMLSNGTAYGMQQTWKSSKS